MRKKENRALTRLNRYMASCGACSRREADRLIAAGRVTVNGKAAVPGMRVLEGDDVRLDGAGLSPARRTVVLAYYKPVGIVCTEKDDHVAPEKLLKNALRYPVRVAYAGRLDQDSEGLLLLSNDGKLIQAMMKGAHGHEREYEVLLDHPVSDALTEGLTKGVYLKELDVTTKPCRVRRIGRTALNIVLTQGLNRQIRRMCAAYRYRVRSLKRVRVMNVTIGALTPGEYRELTADEMRALYRACGLPYGKEAS